MGTGALPGYEWGASASSTVFLLKVYIVCA